jgi:hypothetical protein
MLYSEGNCRSDEAIISFFRTLNRINTEETRKLVPRSERRILKHELEMAVTPCPSVH